MTPTPEQIKAAHDATSNLATCPGFAPAVAAIRAALPPLPGPGRPRICTLNELAVHYGTSTTGTAMHNAGCICETCMGRRSGGAYARAEIIALLEWDLKDCGCGTCMGCNKCRELIALLREADELP